MPRVLQKVELLVDSGAQLDVLNNTGNTPMMTAALYGNIDCVKTIQQAGGDMELQHTGTSATALILASQEGHQDIVEMLVRGGARMDTNDNYGFCSLHKAAKNNREEVVRTLVRLGCDIDMVSRRPGRGLLGGRGKIIFMFL